MKAIVRSVGLCAVFMFVGARPAFALGVTGGSVPLPALIVNGTPQVSWDGEYSDLLAADALAMCWTTQEDHGVGELGVDFGLLTQMEKAGCRTTCSDPTKTDATDIAICAWLDGRQDTTCNVNASSGAPAALDISQIRSPATTGPYVIPTAATLGLSGTSADDVRNEAQGQLASADLDLCIAEQLRDKLDTVQVAFASSDDLGRLLERVRTGTSDAVAEFSFIADALATTQPAPTVVNDPAYSLAPFALWAPSFPSSIPFGNDFSRAIADLIEATDSSMQLKLRDPTAQNTFGTLDYNVLPGDTSGPLIGRGGPRADTIANILYDGTDFGLRWSVTDASAPQVGVLLGLARQANALKISLSGVQVFRATSADTLWLTVENFLRTADCQAQNIPAANCTLGFVGMPTSQSVLYQRHRITAAHAQTLMDALIEAVFGPPAAETRGNPIWTYGTGGFNGGGASLFLRGTGDFLEEFEPAEALGLHLFGHHSFSGNVTDPSPTGVVTIDGKFAVTPLRAVDIQSMRTPIILPYRDLNPSGDAAIQLGFGPLPGTGSTSWLALAREALLTVSNATGPAQGIYPIAAPVIARIERAIGTRQVVIRGNLQGTPNPTACAGCVLLSLGTGVTVDMLTNPADEFTSAAAVPGIPLAATLAADSNTTTIWGQTQASAIASQSFTTLSQSTFPANAAYVLRSLTTPVTSTPTNPQTTVLLESPTTSTFQHVFTGNLANLNQDAASGTIITFGGEMNGVLETAFRFESTNWSSPEFDGFGLPKHFSPAPDASLLGDSPGVSVQQHFLNRAVSAASDATAALQEAFNTLEQQDTDQAALDAANAQSQQLTTLQMQSFCGSAADPQTGCSAGYVNTVPTVPDCSPALTGNSACETFRFDVGQIVGAPSDGSGLGVPLEADVSEALATQEASPTFDNFGGGSLQGLLLDEWNAWNDLTGAMQTGLGNVETAIDQVTVALADADAAQADYNQTQADISAAYAQFAAQVQNLNAQKQQYQANQTQYQAQIDAADATTTLECSDNAFNNAISSGYSYSGDNSLEVWGSANKDGTSGTVFNTKNISFSPGPAFAQVDRCNQAEIAEKSTEDGLGPQKDAMGALINSLAAQVDAINGPGGAVDALPARQAASVAHLEAAFARRAEAAQGADSQTTAALQSIQEAYGRLLKAAVAIDQAFGQAQVATAKIGVDLLQTTYDIRTRFGVRTRFHSFDLFRARALTENARRLAVAARRAIEERYVVDLSTMKAPEAFVDAPSLWADDVYSFDLKPPFAVGLTERPAQANGTYANALTDYVSNLQLFLDGFTIQRPTAAVVSDAEVVQLPAPGAQVVESSLSAATVSFIDPASMGWSFFCPDSGTWVADPDLASFTTGTLTSTLPTVCNGSPPSLARLGFWLDPWGRLRGAIGDPPPFVSRFNVRLGDLAVNLVGSGIRNCELAADPSACFAEPFIRYDLRQVGPVLVTDFDETWKSLDIPIGIIEGGKALSAEEFLDPVTNGFNRPDVGNVARVEFRDRPIGGSYELTLYLSPDVRVENIQRIQLLTQTAYWVRQ